MLSTFPRGGRLGKRLTIFAEFYVEQNEARGRLGKRLTIFAEFCVEQNEARGSLGKRHRYFNKEILL